MTQREEFQAWLQARRDELDRDLSYDENLERMTLPETSVQMASTEVESP